jgi:hypothetical protein
MSAATSPSHVAVRCFLAALAVGAVASCDHSPSPAPLVSCGSADSGHAMKTDGGLDADAAAAVSCGSVGAPAAPGFGVPAGSGGDVGTFPVNGGAAGVAGFDTGGSGFAGSAIGAGGFDATGGAFGTAGAGLGLGIGLRGSS